jgi:hypothetical protein
MRNSQVIENMERETGIEPANGDGVHFVWPQTVMKTGAHEGYSEDRRTIEIVDGLALKSRPRM